MATATKNKTNIFSIRMQPKIRLELEREAGLHDKSTSSLINDLVIDFLDYTKLKRTAIQRGIKDIEEGRVVSGDKVMQALEKWSKDKSGKPFIFESYV